MANVVIFIVISWGFVHSNVSLPLFLVVEGKFLSPSSSCRTFAAPNVSEFKFVRSCSGVANNNDSGGGGGGDLLLLLFCFFLVMPK